MVRRIRHSAATTRRGEAVARAGGLALALAVAGATWAFGQSASPTVTPDDEESVSERGFRERLLVRLDLRTVYYSNYFRVPDELPQDDVREDQGKVRLSYEPGADRRLKIYGEIGLSQYDLPRLENARRGRLGVRSAGSRQEFDTSISFVQNGRDLDLNDTVRASDIWSWSGEYRYRVTDSWQLNGRAGLWEQSFDDGTGDISTNEWGAAVRYRGFGRAFSPELGFRQRRSSGGPAGRDDYGEDLTYLKLRFRPARVLSLSLRYRHRDREYGTSDPSAGNFNRRDERDKWTLGANATLRRNLILTLTYNQIDASSTRVGRDFDSRDLGLSLSLRMGGR